VAPAALLAHLAEPPPGKVAARFGRIDREKIDKVSGDTLCFWGNVPASLVATGTPQRVKDDVKELLELFGDAGTLILGRPRRLPRRGQAGERAGAARGSRRVRRLLRKG